MWVIPVKMLRINSYQLIIESPHGIVAYTLHIYLRSYSLRKSPAAATRYLTDLSGSTVTILCPIMANMLPGINKSGSSCRNIEFRLPNTG